jgi:hypothetical protein
MGIPDFIHDVPPERWLLWVGAGISYPAPTSLPLGIPLTLFTLQECCGETVTTKVGQLWAEANAHIGAPDAPGPLGPVPRLESVLGDVDEVRAEFLGSGFDFLTGFRTFRGAPFNQNHLHIAELLRRGVNVVTMNFDTCIEAAYRHLTLGKDELLLGRELGTPCYSSRSDPNVGKVWHVHGTAHDVRSLGATILAVKEGLPDGFRIWLDNILSCDSLVIFLGYSASDSFDVNLYFGGKPPGQFAASTGWFVQHTGTQVPPSAALLVNPFGRKLITVQETEGVLRSLTGGGPEPLPAETFPWQEFFLSNAITTDVGRVRSYLICKLAFTLGVNVSLLSETAYDDALKHEQDFDSQDFHRTLAYVCRVQGAVRRERQHDALSKRGGVEALGYHYSKGHARRALRHAKSLGELFADARGAGAELGWGTYTSMSAHCRPLVTKYLFNPFSARVTPEDRQKIGKLLELTELLSGVTLKNVQYINQVSTALRFSFLFKALLEGIRDDPTVERVLGLYGDGASIAGFISAYRDMSIMHFFLARFHHGRDSLREALACAHKSLRLARTVGDVPSVKRASRLGAYLRFYALISIARPRRNRQE